MAQGPEFGTYRTEQHETNLELEVLSAPMIVYERGARALNCKRQRVIVPWAQLHCLMVCTGESLQWLPPHIPLNTSGHMVCLWGKNQVSCEQCRTVKEEDICLVRHLFAVLTSVHLYHRAATQSTFSPEF